jgi:hypothetical protein
MIEGKLGGKCGFANAIGMELQIYGESPRPFLAANTK